jgi:hypothetical protein
MGTLDRSDNGSGLSLSQSRTGDDGTFCLFHDSIAIGMKCVVCQFRYTLVERKGFPVFSELFGRNLQGRYESDACWGSKKDA